MPWDPNLPAPPKQSCIEEGTLTSSGSARGQGFPRSTLAAIKRHRTAAIICCVIVLAAAGTAAGLAAHFAVQPDQKGETDVTPPGGSSNFATSPVPSGYTAADLQAADSNQTACQTPPRTALPTVGTVWRNVPRFCCAATGDRNDFGQLLNSDGTPNAGTPYYDGSFFNDPTSTVYRGPIICSQNLASETNYKAVGCSAFSDPDDNNITWDLLDPRLEFAGLLMTCAARGHPYDYVDIKVNSYCRGSQPTCQSWSYLSFGSGPGNSTRPCRDRSSCCVGNNTQTATPNCVTRGPAEAGTPACNSATDDVRPPVGTLFRNVPRYCCAATGLAADTFGPVLGLDRVEIAYNTTYDNKTTVAFDSSMSAYTGPYTCGIAMANLTDLSGCNVKSTDGKWNLTSLHDGVLLKCPALGSPYDLINIKVNSHCMGQQPYCQSWSTIRKDSASNGIGQACSSEASSCCVGNNSTAVPPSCV